MVYIYTIFRVEFCENIQVVLKNFMTNTQNRDESEIWRTVCFSTVW